MNVFRLSNGSRSFITDDFDELLLVIKEEINNEELCVGDVFTLSYELMEQEEFENLPDFEGFN